MAPHICEELYGKDGSIHTSDWPEFDDGMVVEEVVEMAVQVNGKLRDTVSLSLEEASDEDKVVIKAKESEKVKAWLKGKKDCRVVFVPGKLVNFVV